MKIPFALVRTIFLTGSVRAVSAVGAIVLTLYLTNTLEPNDFGGYALCFTMMTLMSMISRFGTDVTLLRFGGEEWDGEPNSKFRALSRLSILIVVRNNLLLIITGFIVVYFFLGDWKYSRLLLFMILLSFPISGIYLTSFILKSIGSSKLGSIFEAGLVSLLATILLISIQKIGLLITYEVVAVALLICAGFLYIAALVVIIRKRILVRTNAPYEKKLLFTKASASVAVVMILQLLANWGGSFFLSLKWSEVEIALFTVALRIISISLIVGNVVNIVVGPKLANLHSKGLIEQFIKHLRNATSILVAITGPMLILIIIFSENIVKLFGAGYASSTAPLTVLAIGQLCSTIFGLAPTTMMMIGLEVKLRRITLIAASCGIAATAILSFYFGALGAATGVSLYQIVYHWMAAFFIKKNYGWWPTFLR